MPTVTSPMPLKPFPKEDHIVRTAGLGREAISSFRLGDGIELNDAPGSEILTKCLKMKVQGYCVVFA